MNTYKEHKYIYIVIVFHYLCHITWIVSTKRHKWKRLNFLDVESH